MAVESSAPSVVPVPEPDLTPRQMIARAEALQPRLRELQADTERRGYLSEEMHDEFVRAGFYRLLQPRMFGGYEFDLKTFFQVMMAIARGCPSTGWGLSLGTGHAVPIASGWSEQAQREIFGPDGHFQSPHRPDALGTALPVDGGYIVNGRWDYLSGIPYATHIIGGCKLLNADGSPPNSPDGPNLQVVIPKGQFTMLDDWGDMLGFKGSGSNTAVVKDAFVPGHWAVNYFAIDRTQGTPGTLLHGNPMYLGHLGAQYSGHLGAVVVGTAKAALDEYEQILRSKKINSPNDPDTPILRYQSPESQRDFGRALTLVDAAEGLMLHAAERHMELCWHWRDEGIPYTQEDNQRLSAMVVHASALAVEAVEIMFSTCGTSPLKDGQRMQRYWRDISIYRAHRVANQLDAAPQVARFHFGLGFKRPGAL